MHIFSRYLNLLMLSFTISPIIFWIVFKKAVEKENQVLLPPRQKLLEDTESEEALSDLKITNEWKED